MLAKNSLSFWVPTERIASLDIAFVVLSSYVRRRNACQDDIAFIAVVVVAAAAVAVISNHVSSQINECSRSPTTRPAMARCRRCC
ncbi:unnamed protein product [Ceratitis capitata]|uniref:(Mediterranean fruit fly) hypothetical protein n=1 Tax=Ceratitis capitata TaxID=7213 RepID=A0A811TXT3_CERCA|nr:unnamed protein product [Ceratitis capitata]